MSEEQPKTPPTEDKLIDDPVVDAIAANAARRIVEAEKAKAEAQPDFKSMAPEEIRASEEKLRARREFEQEEWERAMDIELVNARTNEEARRRLALRGIFPPKEPEDPEAAQMAEDAAAREEASEQKSQEPDKPRRGAPPRYVGFKDKGPPPHVAEEVRRDEGLSG